MRVSDRASLSVNGVVIQTLLNPGRVTEDKR
jgi:hypothetical protein